MNFNEEYNKETEFYDPEVSAERHKKLMRQEERRKDLKAIPYFIGAILLVLFIWWLSSEKTKEISMIYEGYFFADNNDFNEDNLIDSAQEPYSLSINGKVTYSSKLSKEIVAMKLTVTLKDHDGNFVFELSDKNNGELGDKDFCSFFMTEWIYDSDAGNSCNYIGTLYFSNNFKNVSLSFFDNASLDKLEGRLHFAAPATSVEEAYKVYAKILDIWEKRIK